MNRSIARPRKGTNAQLRARVAELSNELAATQAQLEDANRDVHLWYSRVDKARRDGDLQAAHARLATERAEQAERDLDREKRHSASLSADLAHVYSRSKRQGDSLYKTRKWASQLRAERDTLKGDLTACRARCDELAGQLMAAQDRHRRRGRVLAYARQKMLWLRFVRGDWMERWRIAAGHLQEAHAENKAMWSAAEHHRDRAKQALASLTTLRAAHEGARRTFRRRTAVMGALLVLSAVAHAVIALWSTP